MKIKKVKGISFTPTELKVLACFTDPDCSKPSTIARVLGKSTKTIYAHLDKIKTKTKNQTIGDISFFVRKSNEYQTLRDFFVDLFAEYHFYKLARNITSKVSFSSTTCFIVSDNLETNENFKESISSPIKSLHIKTKVVTSQECSCAKDSDFLILAGARLDELKLISEKNNLNPKNFVF